MPHHRIPARFSLYDASTVENASRHNDEIRETNGEHVKDSGEGFTVQEHVELEPGATPQAQQPAQYRQLNHKEQNKTILETCKSVRKFCETRKD